MKTGYYVGATPTARPPFAAGIIIVAIAQQCDPPGSPLQKHRVAVFNNNFCFRLNQITKTNMEIHNETHRTR